MNKILLFLCCIGFNAHAATKFQHDINPPANAHGVWLGADIATSVTINANKTIWLFGDTLIGSVTHHKREVHAIAHNSVGERVCKDHYCHPIHKYFKPQPPFAIFQPKDKHAYLWPTTGLMANHQLIIVAALVRPNSMQNNNFGTSLLFVNNPQAIPTQWKYKIVSWLPMQNKRLMFAAAYKEGSEIYLFGMCKNKHNYRSCYVKLPINKLNQINKSKLVYHNIDGLPAETEYSMVKWHHHFITAMITNGTNTIHFYTAQKLAGPWHIMKATYRINHIPKNCFSYAVKIHPELSKANELVLTYNVNINLGGSLDALSALLKNPANKNLYVPQFVAVEL